MDFGALSFILALIGFFGFILTEFMLDPGDRRRRRVIGLVFMLVTVFFCGVGGFFYLRDHNLFVLPVPGIGAAGTPTPSQDVLFDDFNNSQNQRGYDPNLWYCDGCETNNTIYEDGSVRLGIDSVGYIEVMSISSFRSDKISYLEGRLNMSEYDGPNLGDIHLLLSTQIDSGRWITICYIEGGAEPGFTCAVVTTKPSGEVYEYNPSRVPIKYGDWHTAKIELDSNTFELRFYLDDKIIGSHVPADASELKGKYFKTQFGIASNGASRHIVAYVDDILLSTIP